MTKTLPKSGVSSHQPSNEVVVIPDPLPDKQLRIDSNLNGIKTTMRITHIPSGIYVEGSSFNSRQLKEKLKRELTQKVARHSTAAP